MLPLAATLYLLPLAISFSQTLFPPVPLTAASSSAVVSWIRSVFFCFLLSLPEPSRYRRQTNKNQQIEVTLGTLIGGGSTHAGEQWLGKPADPVFLTGLLYTHRQLTPLFFFCFPLS